MRSVGCRLLLMTFVVTIVAVPARADVRSVLVTESTTKRLDVFTANTQSGALVQTGAPLTTGGLAEAVVMTPNRTFAYVASRGDDQINGFSIDRTTGAVTAFPGPHPSTGDAPRGLAISPDGKFLYSANSGDATISIFSVGSNGTLTPVGSSVPAGAPTDGTTGIAMTSDGHFLYVTNPGTANNIAIFTRDSSAGTLTANGTFALAAGANPQNLAFNPVSNLLAVANQGADNVQVFSVNTVTGALPSPATINDAGSAPTAVKFSPLSPSRIFYTRGSNNTLAVGDVTGATFTPLLGSPFAITGATPPAAIAVSPAGAHLYLTGADVGASSLTGFSTSPVGSSMANLGGSPFMTAMGASATGSVIVGTDASPEADFSIDIKPVGEPTTFTSTSTDPDGSVRTYDWGISGVGNPLVVTLPTSFISTMSYTFTEPGTYRIALGLADNEGCGGSVYNGQMLTCFGPSRIEKEIVIPAASPTAGGETTSSPSGTADVTGSPSTVGTTASTAAATTTSSSSSSCSVSVIGGDATLKKSLNVNRRLRLFFNVPARFKPDSSSNYFAVTGRSKLKKGKVKSPKVSSFLAKKQIKFLLFTLDGKTIGKDKTYPYKVKIPKTLTLDKKHTLVAKAVRRKRPGVKQGRTPARALRFKVSTTGC